MGVWSIVKSSSLSAAGRWDSDHYRPEVQFEARRIAAMPHKPLSQLAHVSDGNHLSIAEEFVETGVRYLRGKDLSDFFVSDADPIYIPEKYYSNLARSHMLANDVLVCVVGANTGQVGMVTDRHGRLTGNCKLGIVRSHSVSPEYIAAYLASRIGQRQILSRIRGGGQTGLILPDLKAIPVIVPNKAQESAVVQLVRGAKAARKEASDTIAAAELLVLSALGLDRLNLSPQRHYIRRFRDLQDAARFGAEYFMPCKKRILDELAKMPHKTVESHAPSIRDMFDPAQARKGSLVRNFDITDALEPFLDDSREPEVATEMGSSKKRFQAGDVVISRLRSYLKEIAVVRTSDALQSVGSSEYIVLRPTGKGLSPETLMVFLRCPLIQTILQWSQDGSNHPRFTEEDLLAIPIPDKLMGVQKRITGLVNTAIDARIEAARLLERAKNTVENLIAKGRAQE